MGVVLALLASVAACGPGGGLGASPGADGVELQVAAAASLKTVLEEATVAYTGVNPRVTFALTTDSSAALRTKIEQGAPVDLFLSADTTQPQALVDAGVADGPVTVFAGNRPTVIVPVGNPAGIETPADLARAGVKVIAAGAEVPITRYAEQLVRTLAGRDGYPADFAEGYAANIVSREDNVSAIVAKLALGEGDAGIVYATDARANADVLEIPVAVADDVEVAYGAVVPSAADAPEEAVAFLAWLTGPGGQAILGDAGFEPVSR
jgi:molybdate transport system substrate-binding protein